MKQLYRSTGWTIEVPAGWTVSEENGVVELRAKPPHGVLQISAARKAGPVVDADVAEFARERLGDEAGLLPAGLGDFQGVRAEYEMDGENWREWWVYRGSLMLYATYTVDGPVPAAEGEVVDGMLASLRAT